MHSIHWTLRFNHTDSILDLKRVNSGVCGSKVLQILIKPYREASKYNPNQTHKCPYKHTASHKTHTNISAWVVWRMFLLWKDLRWQTEGNETQGDIYYQCQCLLSQGGKRGQLKKPCWKLGVDFCMKRKTIFRLHHQNSKVSVERSIRNKLAISCRNLMLWLFYHRFLHILHCLIALLWFISFQVYLIWHLLLYST